MHREKLKWRKDLPKVLEGEGLTGEGVEVGVRAGAFSGIILSQWGGHLTLVDSWTVYENACPHQPSMEQQEEYFRQATRTVEGWVAEGRCSIIREGSDDASRRFVDEQLDFAYIDAGHAYREVMADLDAWFDKVRRGGVIAGDDYANQDEWYEVKRAVDEFFASKQGTLMVLPDETWVFFKE